MGRPPTCDCRCNSVDLIVACAPGPFVGGISTLNLGVSGANIFSISDDGEILWSYDNTGITNSGIVQISYRMTTGITIDNRKNVYLNWHLVSGAFTGPVHPQDYSVGGITKLDSNGEFIDEIFFGKAYYAQGGDYNSLPHNSIYFKNDKLYSNQPIDENWDWIKKLDTDLNIENSYGFSNFASGNINPTIGLRPPFGYGSVFVDNNENIFCQTSSRGVDSNLALHVPTKISNSGTLIWRFISSGFSVPFKINGSDCNEQVYSTVNETSLLKYDKIAEYIAISVQPTNAYNTQPNILTKNNWCISLRDACFNDIIATKPMIALPYCLYLNNLILNNDNKCKSANFTSICDWETSEGERFYLPTGPSTSFSINNHIFGNGNQYALAPAIQRINPVLFEFINGACQMFYTIDTTQKFQYWGLRQGSPINGSQMSIKSYGQMRLDIDSVFGSGTPLNPVIYNHMAFNSDKDSLYMGNIGMPALVSSYTADLQFRWSVVLPTVIMSGYGLPSTTPSGTRITCMYSL